MSLFRRAKPVTVTLEHPSLGELRRDPRSGLWGGEVLFAPLGVGVSIDLCGTETGPDAEAVRALEQLASTFHSLVPALADSLYQLFRPYYEHLSLQDPGSARGFWQLVCLKIIAVDEPDQVELMFGFADEGVWDDAMLSVAIRDDAIVDSWFAD